MPNRARLLDPDHPLDRFAERLRALRRSAMARARSAKDLQRIHVDQVASRHKLDRSTLYAALSGRRLASEVTLFAMVSEWDARGTEALEEWLALRSDTEREISRLPQNSVPYPRREQPSHEDDHGSGQVAASEAARSSSETMPSGHHEDARKPAQAEELTRFLRHARLMAGTPSFRVMARRSLGLVSPTTLANAARGDRLPSWQTVEAFMEGINADEAAKEKAKELWVSVKITANETLRL